MVSKAAKTVIGRRNCRMCACLAGGEKGEDRCGGMFEGRGFGDGVHVCDRDSACGTEGCEGVRGSSRECDWRKGWAVHCDSFDAVGQPVVPLAVEAKRIQA